MRLFLSILLLGVVAPAWADWVKVGEVKKSTHFFLSSTTVYFVDPTTITKDGSVRRVWEIHNLSDTGPSGERSVLASVEYDCADKRVRTLSATGHSEPMASGQIISLRGVLDDWTNLSAGKDDQVFMKILDMVCTP
jgi:hypothetical protein